MIDFQMLRAHLQAEPDCATTTTLRLLIDGLERERTGEPRRIDDTIVVRSTELPARTRAAGQAITLVERIDQGVRGAMLRVTEARTRPLAAVPSPVFAPNRAGDLDRLDLVRAKLLEVVELLAPAPVDLAPSAHERSHTTDCDFHLGQVCTCWGS